MNPDDIKPFYISAETINKYVKPTRIHAGRSTIGVSHPAFTSDENSAGVELKLKECFKALQSDKEFKGAYLELTA